MKTSASFWTSFENYTWKIIEKVAPALPYLGTLLILVVMTTSAWGSKASLVGAQSLREASVKAATFGDYDLAQLLYEKTNEHSNVLGSQSEIENLIYPKRLVEQQILQYESLLEKYPGHRDIYLALQKLYLSIGNIESSKKYHEQATLLDPNNVTLGD